MKVRPPTIVVKETDSGKTIWLPAPEPEAMAMPKSKAKIAPVNYTKTKDTGVKAKVAGKGKETSDSGKTIWLPPPENVQQLKAIPEAMPVPKSKGNLAPVNYPQPKESRVKAKVAAKEPETSDSGKTVFLGPPRIRARRLKSISSQCISAGPCTV